MVNYEEVRAKLTNNELKKLDFAAKNKSGTRLRMIEKNFENKELPLGIFLTRMKTKITNAFANNILIYIKLSKIQLSKIIQLGVFLGTLLSKFDDPLMKVVVSLAKMFWHP